MYKRHTGQLSMLDSPEMFGFLPLDPNNDWIKLSRLVPWERFDEKYAEQFHSSKGQPACDSRMALGSILIKTEYQSMSDENVVKQIAMNPYLQYFIGLHEYHYECPFDDSMMSRFRQRVTKEMLEWVNDIVIERIPDPSTDSTPESITGQVEKQSSESAENVISTASDSAQISETDQTDNQGSMILDATCAPQDIRFPTDASLLNKARLKAEKSSISSIKMV